MVIKATPQILKRVSIRWLPDEAYENTDTIALNVGGFYMDLRVVKADQSLEWSRAGERKAVTSDSPKAFQWTRVIDSLGGTQSDEAVFTELPNGDDLESGTFVKDGTPTAYEEVWRDVTGEIAGNTPSWIIQSKNDHIFYGKVGNICMGMCRDEQGHFDVRREDYDMSGKCWKTVFESDNGAGLSLRRAQEIVQLVEGSEISTLADFVVLGYAR